MKGEARAQGGAALPGWWIVLAAATGLFLGFVPIIGFTFSVFFHQLSQEFGWSRSEISLGFSLALLALSVMLPVSGRLVDRFGARKVIVPAALLLGLGLTFFHFLSDNLWHFYALYLFIGIIGSGTAPIPYYKVISSWFDKRRGLALGLAMGGAGTGTFVMPSLAHALITTVGWRAAYVFLGLMVMVITIPVVGLFLKEKPQMMGLLPDGMVALPGATGKQSGLEGMSSREAWHSGTFWLMSSAFFLVSMSLNGCLIHIVLMLTDRGISPQNAALAASLLGGAVLLGRVGTGDLIDHFRAAHVAVYIYCGAALGVFLLLVGVAGALAFVAAFLVGLGLGGDVMAYVISRYFGARAYGEIYGYALTIYTLGAMIGPLLMGAAFDSTGSYKMILGPFLLTTLLAAGLMALLGSYQFGERVATPATD